MRRFLGALQFLTVLPVRIDAPPLGSCAGWFPVVGALQAVAAWLVYLAADAVGLGGWSAFLAVFILTVSGGGLHEDGLADVSDALRPHRSRHRMLAILEDSRLGSYGVLAMGFILLARFTALLGPVASFDANPWQPRLLATLVVSRVISEAACVVAGYVNPPIGDAIGSWFARWLTLPQIIAVLVLSIVTLTIIPLRNAILITCGSILCTALMSLWFRSRLGGVTGDCLGSVAVVVELQSLMWGSLK